MWVEGGEAGSGSSGVGWGRHARNGSTCTPALPPPPPHLQPHAHTWCLDWALAPAPRENWLPGSRAAHQEDRLAASSVAPSRSLADAALAACRAWSAACRAWPATLRGGGQVSGRAGPVGRRLVGKGGRKAR